jgi:VWA domain-containing protein
VAVALLVGVAAAQPVVEQWDERPERIDAQVFFALDTSRSMLASRAQGTPTRFDRAVAAARRIREALGDVPVGIVSMTDRVLPHLFPSSNRGSFDAVLRHSIGVDKPESDQANNRRATDLGATRFFARGNFYRGSRRRVLVLFTDAETKRYNVDELTGDFSTSGIRAILVRFGNARERVYGPDGVEAEYVPDPASAANAEQYAQAVKGETFDEAELSAVTASIRAKLGSGSSVSLVKTVDIQPLGPFVLIAALLPLSFLLVRRNLT